MAVASADEPPLMVDLMCGPRMPLGKAFLYCGWRCLPVDWVLDPSHDLSQLERQELLREQLQSATFVAAALDCSTKTRSREIPRDFGDGRPCPQPLRSDRYPEGLPDLPLQDQLRVSKDNLACSFILTELAALASRGGGSVRENPARSLHWELAQEKEMMSTGVWTDTFYSACCFMGARCKAQRLRHNIEEIDQWPSLTCHHTHMKGEWDPYVQGGQRVYPSSEEAEYTASLAFGIAVSVSWWAARRGFGKLHVPRFPSVEVAGRREHWVDIDPRALREWAMAPTAVSLGLRPLHPAERARTPERVRVADVLLEDKTLPAGTVYVGLGHHSHRLPVTKWASPFIPGHNCDPAVWLPLYVEHIMQRLAADLHELSGCVLACDCELSATCEGDVLAGLVFEYGGNPARTKRAKQGIAPRGVRQVLAAAAALPPTVGAVIPYMAQESVVSAFCSLYPPHFFEGFQFPMIEDLINQPPFTNFPQWLRHQGLRWDGPLVPMLASPQQRLLARAAEGQQAGALSGKAACPPLHPFGLSCDEHFARSLARADCPLPTEQPPLMDLDLQFAADAMARDFGHLREVRQRALRAIRELKDRWTRVSTRLRHLQPPAIRAATSKRDLGLLGLLVILMSWGDVAMPCGFIEGLPAVGLAPPYGIFPQQPALPLTLNDVFFDCQAHNAEILSSLKPGPHDEFLLSQSVADAEAGFCTAPMTWNQLQRHTQGKPIRLIPRCVIRQSSGKQRIIDNAHAGGQSAFSAESNKLVLCSALRPAQHASLALSALGVDQARKVLQEDGLEGGGEDWPNAYRHCPMSADESRACVVCWHHQEWGCPAFQLYTGLLFGLPLAVTSFNRYSRFCEALGRRLLVLLVSMYFDDAHITDWASSKGSGQQAFRELNALLGSPFADDKRQDMAPTGTFLGLDFDFSTVAVEGAVTFWVRARLQEKVEDMLATAEQTGVLPPGVASKLYGTLNFLEMGVYGRVGTGGLQALKLRQSESTSALTPELRQSIEAIRAVLSLRPKRQVEVLPSQARRFVVASDAAEDVPGEGTGGFLLVWRSGSPAREAFVAEISPAVYSLFTPGDHKIAQLELSMILYAVTSRASRFRGARGIWYIDNVAALMCLIRGRSDSPDLERMAHLIHVALFALQTWIYWEWIPSKSNWADSISRLGWQDRWHRLQGFQCYSAQFPASLWRLPLRPVTLVFEFL